MHCMHKLIVFVLLALPCSTAVADTLNSPVEARKLTDQVMTKVGAGETEDGVRLTKPFLIIPVSEFDVMLEQLKLQMPAISHRFGKSIGSEFIREDRVGEHLLRIVHLHRFEKHAMRWRFYFYQGNAGWVLNTFKTDDDLPQLFPQ